MALHPQLSLIIIHMITVMNLAILGNLLLIFIIFRTNSIGRRQISPVQLLLLNTCVADLLFALLSLGTEVLIILTYPKFAGPDWLCRLIRYLQIFPLYTSPFLLVAISINRFQAICRPLAHYRSGRFKRPTCLATIAWLTALICSLPQLFVWYKAETGACVTIYGRDVSLLKSFYVIYFNSIAWLIPSLIAAIFYYCVCKTVWSSHYRASHGQISDQSDVQLTFTSAATECYVKEIRKMTDLKRTGDFTNQRLKTVRLTMTIIFCHFFLWAPFCVANVLQAIVPSLISAQLITYIIILGNLNSCVNPWIYMLFNRNQIKKAFCPSANNSQSRSASHEPDTKGRVNTETINFAQYA